MAADLRLRVTLVDSAPRGLTAVDSEQPLAGGDVTGLLRIWSDGAEEAFDRLMNRSHFFGVSAQMMRRVLVDIARRRGANRRGGGDLIRVPLERVDLPAGGRDTDLVAIDRALAQLAAADGRKARVVELRFFGGLSVEEIAQALGLSVRTVQGEWAFARAWLYGALSDGFLV